jgi:hypothetical protein
MSSLKFADNKSLTDEEIRSAAAEGLNAQRWWGNEELQSNWSEAYGYYKGELPPATMATDSTAISTDVSDVVEWLLPAILKPLIESPDVVRFDPVNPEDQDQADTESDYVHHTFMKKCNGFVKLYNHIKDALLLKNAIFFTYWDETVTSVREEYENLLEEELADLLSPADGSEVRVVSSKSRQEPLPDPMTGLPYKPPAPSAVPGPAGPPPVTPGTNANGPPPSPQQATMGQAAPTPPPGPTGPPMAPQGPLVPPGPPMLTLYNVVVRRFVTKGKPCVENCRPEAFSVDMGHGSVDLTDARWCCYTTVKTRAELLALGYKEDLIDEIPAADAPYDNDVRWSREDVERETQDLDGNTNPTQDPSQDKFDIQRVYMTLDADGDGFEEKYLIILGGGQGEVLLDYYEVPENPFSASTPFIAAHKFYGYSIFDKVRKLCDHKTKVLRMLEDNLDLTNNPRKKVVRGQANLDDVLLSTVGGIWRVDDVNAVTEVPTQQIQMQAQYLLDYYDKQRAERTGVDPNAQAITNVMPDESMNHAVERVLSMKEELVGMLIRVFAETGVKGMFCHLRNLMLRKMPREELVQLRNKWATVNPGNWVERTNTTIVVGLGTGDRIKKQNALLQILGIQQKLAETGMMGPLVSPERINYTISELIRVTGLGDPDDYVLDPTLLERENPQSPSPRARETLRALQMGQQQAQQAQQAEAAKAQAMQQAQAQQTQLLGQMQIEVEKVKGQAKLMEAQMQAAEKDKDRWQQMQQFLETNQREWAALVAQTNTDQAKVDANLTTTLVQESTNMAIQQHQAQLAAQDRQIGDSE